MDTKYLDLQTLGTLAQAAVCYMAHEYFTNQRIYKVDFWGFDFQFMQGAIIYIETENGSNVFTRIVNPLTVPTYGAGNVEYVDTIFAQNGYTINII